MWGQSVALGQRYPPLPAFCRTSDICVAGCPICVLARFLLMQTPCQQAAKSTWLRLRRPVPAPNLGAWPPQAQIVTAKGAELLGRTHTVRNAPQKRHLDAVKSVSHLVISCSYTPPQLARRLHTAQGMKTTQKDGYRVALIVVDGHAVGVQLVSLARLRAYAKAGRLTVTGRVLTVNL